jgi:hypothetical protein
MFYIKFTKIQQQLTKYQFPFTKASLSQKMLHFAKASFI